MSSDGSILFAGIILALMLTAASLKQMPSAFWEQPFIAVFIFCSVVFFFWSVVYYKLVKVVKR
jgi:hypothetical protein